MPTLALNVPARPGAADWFPTGVRWSGLVLPVGGTGERNHDGLWTIGHYPGRGNAAE